MQWVFYSVPYWVWIVVAILIVGLVHRLFGLRNALVAAAVAVAAIFYARARQRGWKDREREIERDRLRAIKERKESDEQVDHMGAADRDREWSKWLRDKR